MASNSNGSGNRNTNTGNRRNTDEMPDGIYNFLNDLLTQQPGAFLYIGSRAFQDFRSASNNNELPVILFVDLTLYPQNLRANTNRSRFFSNFFNGLFSAMKKKELVRKGLENCKCYRFRPSMPKGECSICLGDFIPKQSIRKLKCDHEFHKSCVDKWLLSGSGCCPICRVEPFVEKDS